MQHVSFWFYESSLFLSLSLFPSPDISLSSWSPDAGHTEHFGETQLFYTWDQRQIVCAFTFSFLCPCDFKNIVLVFSSVKYYRFRIQVCIKEYCRSVGQLSHKRNKLPLKALPVFHIIPFQDLFCDEMLMFTFPLSLSLPHMLLITYMSKNAYIPQRKKFYLFVFSPDSKTLFL